MGTSVTKRFRNYDIVSALADPVTVPTGEVVCVTGDDADCGATSGRQEEGTLLSRWMAEHYRDTGHQHFECVERSPLHVEPGTWR